MTPKTYTEIVNDLCDAFDAELDPKKIARSNDNLLYLDMKAKAKGYEVIHNAAVLLDGKFDPSVCPDADLESTGKLVGTKRLSGKATALRVVARNTTEVPVSLPAGTYRYYANDDVIFELSLASASAAIAPSAEIILTFYSTKVGSYRTTAQSSITLYYVEGATHATQAGIEFSSLDNVAYLGRDDESFYAFRKRILQDTNRQDSISEMEMAIKDLPYIFDAAVVFNGTGADAVIEGVTVHPFCILVAILGDPKDEIADIVASFGYYPTTQVDPAKVLQYHSTCLAGGVYNVYYTTFDPFNYDINVNYAYSSSLSSPDVIEPAIGSALIPFQYPTERIESITENTFYSIIDNLSLQGIRLRNITLIVGGTEVPYIDVPKTRLGTLVNVTFTKEVLP